MKQLFSLYDKDDYYTIDSIYKAIHIDDVDQLRTTIEEVKTFQTERDVFARFYKSSNSLGYFAGKICFISGDETDQDKIVGFFQILLDDGFNIDDYTFTQQHYLSFIRNTNDNITVWKAHEELMINLPVEKQIDMLYQSTCLYANKNASNAFGVESFHEILGISYESLVNERTFNDLFRSFIVNDYVLLDYESFDTPSGNDWYGLTTLIANVVNGYVETIWEISKDITIQKQNELKLKRTIEELERVKSQIEKENIYLREEIQLSHNYSKIIGNSEAVLKMLGLVELVAPTDTTVLVLGETGTGKELVSRAIHNTSSRSNKPLIKINCGTLSPNLIESELFGHEKGSFTGAIQSKTGKFELADGGTIFIDEIGELPKDLQTKFLRVLQEGEIQRIGSNKSISVDVRVIAATNRSLEQLVQNRRFRQDLYYRLCVFPITCPPLRERVEDITNLTRHFVNYFEKKIGKQIARIPGEAIEELKKHNWPGNIRELKNVIERAVIISRDNELNIDLGPSRDFRAENSPNLVPLEEIEREHILHVLDSTNWKITGPDSASKILDVNPSTLYSRLRKLNITLPNRK